VRVSGSEEGIPAVFIDVEDLPRGAGG
jgi:hypothetical protein